MDDIKKMSFEEIENKFQIYREIENKIKGIKHKISLLNTTPLNEISINIEKIKKEIDNIYNPEITIELPLPMENKKIGRPKLKNSKIETLKNKVLELLKSGNFTTLELYEKCINEELIKPKSQDKNSYNGFRGSVIQPLKDKEKIFQSEKRKGAPWGLIITSRKEINPIEEKKGE